MKHFYLKSLLICLFASCMDISAYAAVPQGDGSLSNPFNTSAALNKAQELAVGETSSESYYIQGKISRTQSLFSEQFGTAIFWISDDGSTSEEFYIYATYFLENTSWVEGCQQIAVGDDVVIYGKLANYRGTLETASRGSYIYSLNGKTKIQEDETPTELKAGDLFTAKTMEDINMTFSVVNPEQKTCQVGGAVPDQEGYYYITIDKSTVGTVTIPEEANGYKVVGIERVAFSDCQYITGIVLPKELMYIHSGAFENCKSLSQINIPERITSIESATFYGCSGLTTISLPNNLTSIDNSVFYGCSAISSITIPERVTFIGSNAFEGCSNLTTITINSNTIVSQQYTSTQNIATFFGTQVKEVILGEDITEIGAYAFAGLSKLVGITIPKNTTNIGQYAFSGCSNLTNIIIPEQVTSIGGNAFYHCSNLTSIIINSDAIVSEQYTDSNNLNDIFGTQVQKFVIGDNVREIGDYAFSGSYNLIEISLPSNLVSLGKSCFSGCHELATITMPNNLISIGEYAFYNCRSLPSITIPNTVTTIGKSAFSECKSLTSFTIPNSLTSIEDDTFWYCLNLTSVIIPNSVTTIGSRAFAFCESLTSLSIPQSVKSIGQLAFTGTSNLAEVVVEKGNLYYDSRENCKAIIETSSNTLIRGCNTSVIPNSIETIGDYAFSNCSSLKNITIPLSVRHIGKEAFSDCLDLTSVVIPISVRSIGSGAFWNCISLQTVTSKLIEPFPIDEVFNYWPSDNSGIKPIKARLCVPAGTKSVYASTKGWTDLICEESDLPNGTSERPFNIEEYLAIEKDLQEKTWKTYYVKGTILKIDELFNSQNGYASFQISSDNSGSNQLSINSSLYLENRHWAEGDIQIKEGDVAVVGRTSVNSYDEYFFPVKEFKNYIYSINGDNGIYKDGDIFTRKTIEGVDMSFKIISANDRTCEVTQNFNNEDLINHLEHGSITIPSVIHLYIVTGIGESAFSGYNALNSITIPNNVTTIGRNAFNQCVNLSSITIPNTVSNIGHNAFNNCI